MAQTIRCRRCGVTTDDGAEHYRSTHGVEPKDLPKGEWIGATVDAWPTFTPAQRDRLAILLRAEPLPPVRPAGGSALVEMMAGE